MQPPLPTLLTSQSPSIMPTLKEKSCPSTSAVPPPSGSDQGLQPRATNHPDPSTASSSSRPLPPSRFLPLPTLGQAHRGWISSRVSTAKCDFCHRQRCGALQKCVECMLSVCRDCALADRLADDGRHFLDFEALDWSASALPKKSSTYQDSNPAPTSSRHRGILSVRPMREYPPREHSLGRTRPSLLSSGPTTLRAFESWEAGTALPRQREFSLPWVSGIASPPPPTPPLALDVAEILASMPGVPSPWAEAEKVTADLPRDSMNQLPPFGIPPDLPRQCERLPPLRALCSSPLNVRDELPHPNLHQSQPPHQPFPVVFEERPGLGTIDGFRPELESSGNCLEPSLIQQPLSEPWALFPPSYGGEYHLGAQHSQDSQGSLDLAFHGHQYGPAYDSGQHLRLVWEPSPESYGWAQEESYGALEASPIMPGRQYLTETIDDLGFALAESATTIQQTQRPYWPLDHCLRLATQHRWESTLAVEPVVRLGPALNHLSEAVTRALMHLRLPQVGNAAGDWLSEQQRMMVDEAYLTQSMPLPTYPPRED